MINPYETPATDPDDRPEDAFQDAAFEADEGAVQRGHVTVVTVALVVLGFSLFIMLFSMLASGSLATRYDLVRIGLEVALLVLIYKGQNWARLLLMVLLWLFVLFMAVVIVKEGNQMGIIQLPLLIIWTFAFSACAFALRTPNVIHFQEHQRWLARSQTIVVPCPNCSCENGPHTKICPRCGEHVA